MGQKLWYVNAEGSGEVEMGKKLRYIYAEGSGDAVIDQNCCI